MNKRQIFLLSFIAFAITFCFFGRQIGYEIYRKVNFISAGSYPNAETYNLKFSELEVKQALKELKTVHPEYNIPRKFNVIQFEDHQTENPSFWYISYFYFQEDNEILYTYTRSNGKSETTFAFVEVQDIETKSWKDINSDFNYAENQMHIEKFEKRILKVLNNILEKNKAAGNSGLAQ